MAGLANALSLFRIAMLPLLGVCAWLGEATWFLAGFAASLLSDAVDGFVARRSNAVTPLGARLDSLGDLVTFSSLPLFAWWLWPEIVRAQSAWLAVALCAYVAPIGVGWLRFGRLTSYHTWAAKATAVWMGVALFALFAGGPAWPFQVGVVLLVLECSEEIAISLALREWQSDVPTLWHALRSAR